METYIKTLVTDTFNELSSKLTDYEIIKKFALTLDDENFTKVLNNIKAIYAPSNLSISDIIIFPDLEIISSRLDLGPDEDDMLKFEYFSRFKNLKYATLQFTEMSAKQFLNTVEKFIKQRSKFNVSRDFLITTRDKYNTYIIGNILSHNFDSSPLDRIMKKYDIIKKYQNAVIRRPELIFDFYILEFNLEPAMFYNRSIINVIKFFASKNLDYALVFSKTEQNISAIINIFDRILIQAININKAFPNLITFTIPIIPREDHIALLRNRFPNVKEFFILADSEIPLPDIKKIDNNLNYQLVYLQNVDEKLNIPIYSNRRIAIESKANLAII